MQMTEDFWLGWRFRGLIIKVDFDTGASPIVRDGKEDWGSDFFVDCIDKPRGSLQVDESVSMTHLLWGKSLVLEG